MLEMLEQEPTFNESSEVASEVIEPPKKEFLIEEHEAWRSIWESWPQEHREHLIPIIEAKRLDPEIYNNAHITISRAEADRKMSERYSHLGLNDRNVAADVDYSERKITLYPEFNKYDAGMRAHVAAHEISHLAGSHLINPSNYLEQVRGRLENHLDTNGKYIQAIGRNIPEDVFRKILAHERDNSEDFKKHSKLFYSFLDEMMTDDLADYIKSTSPEEMLAHRLERAGTQEELKKHEPEVYEALYAEAEQLFNYFGKMLDPKRQEEPETRLDDSELLEWLELMGSEAFDAPFEVPIDIATPLYSPPKKRGSKGKKQGFFSWFFGLFG